MTRIFGKDVTNIIHVSIVSSILVDNVTNATYIRITIQNELISLLAEQIRQEISDVVN